jgi:hypothetical protein
VFSNQGFHEGRDKIKKVYEWLKAKPHLEESGGLVDKPALLEICLGIGILLKDIHLIQFTEDEFPEGTPDYICHSSLELSDSDELHLYLTILRDDLSRGAALLRYVIYLDIQRGVLAQSFSSSKKRKASLGEVAHGQTQAKKAATRHASNLIAANADDLEGSSNTG